MTDNPLFETWPEPGLPPFDRIRAEHFAPGFERGMAEEVAEIAAIAGAADPPTFANTIEAMERAGRLLRRVSRVFFNLNSSHTDDALQEIARNFAPLLARHRIGIVLNAALFQRIADLFARRESLGLDADQLRLLERKHREFIRGGAMLAPVERQRMAAISERLATLHTAFGQNVLHDEKEWRLELGPADLDGLPPFVCSAAAEAARERGLEGRYVVTLARSSVEPFLTFSARRDL